MKLSHAIYPGKVWSTSVSIFQGELLDMGPGREVLKLGEPTLRWRRHHVEAIADPFLHVADGQLWLFVEERRDYLPAYITCYSTADLANWFSHGIVLQEQFHLSYPQVFEHAGSRWMVPESVKAGQVRLYVSKRWPGEWSCTAVLLDAPHADPTIFRYNDFFYLWGTDSSGSLRLYFSANLAGPYSEHPASPITSDKRYSRCGGPVYVSDGVPMRISQDCEITYGSNINAHKIEKLSPKEYSESLFRRGIITRGNGWNRYGAHHLSSVCFRNESVMAVDGLGPDILANNLIKAFFRVASR